MADERKVFSEQEVTAVVRRAVELQEKAGQESYTPGVTASELETIAKELGIDPKFLQQAISEGATERKSGHFHLTEEFERVVDTELQPEDYDILLKYIRRTGNHDQGFAQVGRTFTGRTWTGCSIANFEVTSKQGRTRVNLKSGALFAWLVTIYPASLATLVLLPVLSNRGHAFLALAIVLPLLTIAGLAFKSLLKRGHQAAKEVTDKFAQAIADTAKPQSDVRSKLTAPSMEARAEPETTTQSI